MGVLKADWKPDLSLHEAIDHQNLDLERLHLAGEDGAEHGRVLVGQALAGHIFPGVGVSLLVGVADPRLPKILLVDLSDAAKGDSIVDLGDLAQVGAAVLRQHDHPTIVLESRISTPSSYTSASTVVALSSSSPLQSLRSKFGSCCG